MRYNYDCFRCHAYRISDFVPIRRYQPTSTS